MLDEVQPLSGVDARQGNERPGGREDSAYASSGLAGRTRGERGRAEDLHGLPLLQSWFRNAHDNQSNFDRSAGLPQQIIGRGLHKCPTVPAPRSYAPGISNG